MFFSLCVYYLSRNSKQENKISNEQQAISIELEVKIAAAASIETAIGSNDTLLYVQG